MRALSAECKGLDKADAERYDTSKSSECAEDHRTTTTHTKKRGGGEGEDIKIRIQLRQASNRDIFSVISEMQGQLSCQYPDSNQYSSIKTESLRTDQKPTTNPAYPHL